MILINTFLKFLLIYCIYFIFLFMSITCKLVGVPFHIAPEKLTV